MRIRGVKTELEEEGLDTSGMVETTAKLRDEVKALSGVDIMKNKNTFKSTYQILDELSQKWSQLTDKQQAAITELLAGKHQGNVMSSLMTNFDKAREALNVSLNSEGSAMKEHEKWLDSVEAKQLQLKASWEGLSKDFLSSDLVKGIVDGARMVLNAIDSIVNAIGTLGTVSIGAGLVGVIKIIKTISDTDKFSNLQNGFKGLLSVITSIPAPLLAIAAGLTAVGVAAHAINKNKYNKQFKWSEGLSEQAAKAKEASNKFAEIAKLQKEVSDIKLTIQSKDSSTEDLTNAKNRLQEISDYLNQEYGLEVQADTGQLDDALSKLKEIKYLESTATQSTLGNDLSSKKSQYETAKANLESFKEDYEIAAEKSKNYNFAKAAIDKIESEYPDKNNSMKSYFEYVDAINKVFDFYNISEEEMPRLEKNFYAEGRQENRNLLSRFNNLKYNYNKEADINGKNNAYSKYQDTLNSIEEFEASAKEYTENALLELEYGDKNIAIKQLAEAVKNFGISADETAIKATKAEAGIKSFSEIAGNSEKVQQAINNYQKYANEFGASSKDIAVGSALVANGFESIPSVVNSGSKAINSVISDMKRFGEQSGLFEGLDSSGISNKLTEIAHSIGLLPDTKHIELSVDGDVSVIDDVKTKVDEINSNKNIKLSIGVDGDIKVLKTADEQLKKFADSGMVNIKFNVDTGNMDILNSTNGANLGEITADGKVIWKSDMSNIETPEGLTAEGTANYTLGVTPGIVPDASGTANYDLGEHPTDVPDVSGNANYTGNFPTKAPTLTGTIIYKPKVLTTSQMIDRTNKYLTNGKGLSTKGSAGVDGTAHVYGTAYSTGTLTNYHKYGRALKNGDWGTTSDGFALGGELGEELIVRDGKFFTIGAQSAELFTYKKDDIIFNAEQTKQIFEKGKITHGNRRGKAFAKGINTSNVNTMLYSNGSAIKSDFNLKYNEHQHLLAMDKETLEDYLGWLSKAYKTAYESNEITIDDFYKYEEEVYEKSAKLFNDYIADKKHKIGILSNDKNNTENIIAIYKEMQESVHQQAEYYRSLGLEENNDKIQELQNQWLEYGNSIKKVISDNYDDYVKLYESRIELNKHFLEESFADENHDDIDKYLNDIITDYTAVQEIIHNQAEYYRSLGAKEHEQEILDLQIKWLEYESHKKDTQKETFDERLKMSEEYISNQAILNWANGDSEIEARRRILEWMTSDYYRNLIDNDDEYNSILLENLEKYNNAVKESLNSSLDSLNRYRDNIEDTYDKLNESYDKIIKKLQAFYDIQSKNYDVINQLTAAQHEADKAISNSRILKQYLNDDDYKLIYNEEDYDKISTKISNINEYIRKLTKSFNNQISDAYDNGQIYLIESITSEYERQLEIKKQELDLAQAEVDLVKKKQNLENVLAEKNIRQITEKNGVLQWEWVSDVDKVRSATEEFSEAQYKIDELETQRSQQLILNAMQKNIDSWDNAKEANDYKLQLLDEAIEKVKNSVEGITEPVMTLEAAVSSFEKTGVSSLSKAVNDMLGVFEEFTEKSYERITVPNGTVVKAGADGKAPKGLSAGTLVETDGGNYLISNVKADGSYDSIKINNIKGYASGIKSANAGLAMVNEESSKRHNIDKNKIHSYLTNKGKLSFGDETYISKDGTFHTFSGGETVFSGLQTEALWNISKDLVDGVCMPPVDLKSIERNEDNSMNLNGNIIIQSPDNFNDFVSQLTNAFRRNRV